MREKTKLKIGEFSQMMQVTVKTLRHYKQKGLLMPYKVNEWTGYRYYSIDLMHFGWNIGKAFGKRRIHTATFIKNVFAYALRNLEVSTIERKMSHTESECRIKLDDNIA